MKVLRVIARLNVGGPARHVTVLDRGLRAGGVETLLLFGPPGPDEGSLEELADGLPHRVVPELGRRIHVVSDAVAFVRILLVMFRYGPDVVHTHTAKAGTLGRLAAAAFNLTRPRRSRALVVHTFHGHVLSGYFGPLGSRLVRVAERALALLTDRIVAISERQRHDLSERFAIGDPSAIITVPLGLDLRLLLEGPDAGSSLREALGLASETVVIGFVGRLVAIKNPSLLVAAFDVVARRAPMARLMIAGNGPLLADVRAEVSRRGLDDKVRFIGWQKDLPSLYRACDLVVLTSINEGTPVALIEAMAAGVPVVATPVGGVPDVIRDGETGLLASDDSVEGVAAVMSRLVEDPALRRALGEAGRRAVEGRFSQERLVADIHELYRSGLAEVRGAPAR